MWHYFYSFWLLGAQYNLINHQLILEKKNKKKMEEKKKPKNKNKKQKENKS